MTPIPPLPHHCVARVDPNDLDVNETDSTNTTNSSDLTEPAQDTPDPPPLTWWTETKFIQLAGQPEDSMAGQEAILLR